MKKLQCCKKCFCFKHLQQISVLSGEVGDPGDGSPASAAEQRDPASLEAGQRRRRLRSTRGLNLSSHLETTHFRGFLASETSTMMSPQHWFCSQVPEQHEKTLKFVKWRYYLGLGTSFYVILVIIDMSSDITFVLFL